MMVTFSPEELIILQVIFQELDWKLKSNFIEALDTSVPENVRVSAGGLYSPQPLINEDMPLFIRLCSDKMLLVIVHKLIAQGQSLTAFKLLELKSF